MLIKGKKTKKKNRQKRTNEQKKFFFWLFDYFNLIHSGISLSRGKSTGNRFGGKGPYYLLASAIQASGGGCTVQCIMGTPTRKMQEN